VEEAVATGGSSAATASAGGIPGISGANGACGVCGGVGVRQRQDARLHERQDAGLGQPAAGLAGSGKMIQIRPQMRVLVAVEAVDFRKGIESLAELGRD